MFPKSILLDVKDTLLGGYTSENSADYCLGKNKNDGDT